MGLSTGVAIVHSLRPAPTLPGLLMPAISAALVQTPDAEKALAFEHSEGLQSMLQCHAITVVPEAEAASAPRKEAAALMAAFPAGDPRRCAGMVVVLGRSTS